MKVLNNQLKLHQGIWLLFGECECALYMELRGLNMHAHCGAVNFMSDLSSDHTGEHKTHVFTSGHDFLHRMVPRSLELFIIAIGHVKYNFKSLN